MEPYGYKDRIFEYYYHVEPMNKQQNTDKNTSYIVYSHMMKSEFSITLN